jgi:hypothetical protein
MYGLVNDNGIWTATLSDELYALYDELDVVQVINRLSL